MTEITKLSQVVTLPKGDTGFYKIPRNVIESLHDPRSTFDLLEELLFERAEELGYQLTFSASYKQDELHIWWGPRLH